MCMKVIQVCGKNFMLVSDLSCVLYENKLSKCVVHTIIQFLNEEGIEPREIHQLCVVCNVLAERQVYRWVEQFNKGWTTAHDEDKSGCPPTVINEETVNTVCAILSKDRHYIFDDFNHKMATQYSYADCCHMSIFNILTKELEMKKVRSACVQL